MVVFAWNLLFSNNFFLLINYSVTEVPCGNRTVNTTLDIQSDRCVEGKCNDKGNCAVYLQGRLLVSTCVCQGGKYCHLSPWRYDWSQLKIW